MSSEPVTACPKCGHHSRQGASACSRCGLVFANWSPGVAAPLATLDAAGEQLWADVVANWSDDVRHEAFVKHSSVSGTLGAAGRRYRERLDASPDDQVAARMQERILGLATVGFTVTRSQAPTSAPVTRHTWFWVVLGVCAAGGMIGGLLFGRSSR